MLKYFIGEVDFMIYSITRMMVLKIFRLNN